MFISLNEPVLAVTFPPTVKFEVAEPLMFPLEVMCDDTFNFPPISNIEPLKSKLASPFSASALEKVAILLFEPLATADTAPPPPPPAANEADVNIHHLWKQLTL